MCDSSSHHTNAPSSTALFATLATTILLIGSLLVIAVAGGPGVSASAPRPTFVPGVRSLTALSASFTTNVSSGPAPLAVGFTITASGGSTPYTFHWYFGDGSSCTTCISTSAKHTYTSAGTYTVKLFVIDSAGTNASGGSTTISATTSLSASFTTNVSSGPAPLAVGFTITASGGSTPYTFHWYFGDGSSCTTCISTSAKHTYTSAGTYTVKLFVIDSAGTNASGGSTTISATTSLSASFTTNVSSGPAPLAVGFTITASGGSTPYTFHWYFGDGSSCTTCISTSAKHTYTSAGTYTVKLFVIDSAGTNASGGSTTISATTSLSASFTTNVSSGPAPLAVGFTITASGGSTPYTFHWYFGDGSSCTTCISTSAKHTYTSAGTYTVKLFVIDSAGTNASGGSTTITVSPSGVTASFTTNVSAGPAPLAVGFTISVSTTRSYWFHWYFGDGSSCTRCTSTSASHTYTSPGNYTVRLYAIDQSTGLNITGGSAWIDVTNKYVPLTCIGTNLGTVWASLSSSLPASQGGFTGSATATINGSLTSTFKLCLAVSGASFTRLSTSVTLFTNASLNFTASGGYQYSTGSSPITLGKPYSGPWIYIPGTFLVFVPIVTPVLILDATMAGSLTLGAVENSSTTLGMNWSSAGGWSSIYHAPSCLNGATIRALCFKPNQPSWGASASIRAELGLEVSLALYGIRSELTFGPYVQFSAAAGSSSTLQPTACGALTMGSSDPDWFGLCGGFAASAGASVGLFGYEASTYTAAERNLTTTLLAASVAISPASSSGSPVKVVHGSTLTLSVTVAGDSSFGSYGTVKWAVKGTGCGTISTSGSGASATYTASATVGVTCKIVATLAGGSVVLQSIGLDQAAGWIKQT